MMFSIQVYGVWEGSTSMCLRHIALHNCGKIAVVIYHVWRCIWPTSKWCAKCRGDIFNVWRVITWTYTHAHSRWAHTTLSSLQNDVMICTDISSCSIFLSIRKCAHETLSLSFTKSSCREITTLTAIWGHMTFLLCRFDTIYVTIC